MNPSDTPYPLRRGKRLGDLLISAVLLLLLAPLFLGIFVAMAIAQCLRPPDRGPWFYREPRISRGQRFTILKFRTVQQAVIDAARVAAREERVVEVVTPTR